MTAREVIMIVIAAIAITLGVNYLLAMAGEPSSTWFMQTLGLMK